MNTEKFTRQQLYDLVWSEPLLSLSKRYNISDVGLRKICILMSIPLPEVGYWNKVKAGKAVTVKKLSKDHDGEKEISLTPRIAGKDGEEIEVSPQIALQRVIENDPTINLTVPTILIDPDPIVSRGKKELLERAKHTRDNELFYPSHIEFYIKVTPKTLDRALCTMDTFLKAMRKRGHEFIVKEGLSYIMINGKEEMKMTLRETSTRVIIKGRYWDTSEYHPNGILSLSFEHYRTTIAIKDGKELIEHQLSKIMSKLEILGDRFKIERLENEEYHRRRKEQERLEKEFADRKRLELDSFTRILKDSRRWNEAVLLREYIVQVEQKAIAENVLNEEFIEWLVWARKKADWFDPLLKSSDEWLDSVDQNTLYNQVVNFGDSAGYSTYERPSNNISWPLAPWYFNK